MSIIYKTTNLANGKIYVGQHYTSANDGYLGSGKIIKLAIKKYGKEKFVRETIEFCTSANVDDKEVYWIDKLNTINPDIGYNLDKGGGGGNKIIWTEEKRKEHSKIMKGKMLGEDNPNFGKSRSEKTRLKISQSKIGKIPSKETKQKMSKSHKGKNNHNFGKHFSKETLEKMSEVRSGEKGCSNKYYYYCSDNKDYWIDFTKNERIHICAKFRRKHSNIIFYKNITITRKLK